MKNSVLMIGAGGMLGRPVARRLVQDGFKVHGLARNPDKMMAMLPPQVKIIPGNLEDVASIDAAMNDCSAVYLSVDSLPNAKFLSETDGLKNVIAAAKNHDGIRLLVLSALGSSNPMAEKHPWWHIREKFEAQRIAKTSRLAWTIFEPTWFMESLPLFVKGNFFMGISGVNLEPYWIAGDDFGRMISISLKEGKGKEEIVPVQGVEKISLYDATRLFIQAYNPAIKLIQIPFWTMKLMSPLDSKLNEFVSLLKLYGAYEEPEPSPDIWKKFSEPSMDIRSYAGYSRRISDFPQK